MLDNWKGDDTNTQYKINIIPRTGVPNTSPQSSEAETTQQRVLRVHTVDNGVSFEKYIMNKLQRANGITPPVLQSCSIGESKLNLICVRDKGFIDFRNRYDSYERRGSNPYDGTQILTQTNVSTRWLEYEFESHWEYFHCPINEFDEKWIYAQWFQSWPMPDHTEKLNDTYKIIQTKTWIFLTEWGKEIRTIIWEKFCLIPQTPPRILIINNNHFEWCDVNLQNWEIQNSQLISHPYGEIKKVLASGKGNFIIIHTQKTTDNNGGKIFILHAQTLHEITHIDDIGEIIYIDALDNIRAVTHKKTYVNINTNMDHFPEGYVQKYSTITSWENEIIEIKDSIKEELERVLANTSIELTQADVENHSNEEISTLEQHIWKIPISEKPLFEWYNEAETLEDMEFVQKALDKIRSLPELAKFSDLTQKVGHLILQKKSKFKLDALKTHFQTLTENIGMLHTLGEWLTLSVQLKQILQDRSQNLISDSEFDQALKNTLQHVQENILKFRDEQKGELIKEAEKSREELRQYLDSITYLSHVTSVYNTKSYQDFTRIVDLMPDEEKKKWIDEVQSIISQRINHLQQDIETQKLKKEKEILAQKKSLQEDLSRLGQILAGIEEESVLEEMQENDSFVIQIESRIENLEANGTDKLLIALKQVFLERKQQIRLSQLSSKSLIRSLDEYGIDISLYFVSEGKESSVWYELKGTRLSDGNIRLSLQFENGVNFDLDAYLSDPEKYARAIPFSDIETEVTQKEFLSLQKNISAWKKTGKQKLFELQQKRIQTTDIQERKKILQEIVHLKSLYKTARSVELLARAFSTKLELSSRVRLVTPNPKFIVLDEEKAILESMSLGFQIQKQEQKGIDILEGPPWLGKTEICKFFAWVTNREIIRVQCSKMDPSDLFFAPQLRAWETTRQPAEWISLMQKPGTIVLFDEIDKLNPQSFERLHSLFDSQRAIYDPQIGWVRANSDCVFVGTRNSYELMSNPIVSRSFIIPMNAPWSKNEAFKISKYSHLPYFDKLSFDDFCNLYDEVLKAKTQNEATKILMCIRLLVQVFQWLRAKQTMDGYHDRFVYEISYRDAEQIFLRFDASQSVELFQNKVCEVLIPKARAVVYENEDKETQEKILKEVVEEVFRS